MTDRPKRAMMNASQAAGRAIDGANLEEIYRLCNTPELRDRARALLRQRTRTQAKGRPLTGAYYWVPVPSRTAKKGYRWKIQEFFDGWTPSSDHVYVWKHVVDSLERAWGRNVKDCDYCSLPRGRICRREPKSAGYALYHGNDSPVGPEGLVKVAALFNLVGRCKFIFDEHEQMIAGQPEILSRRLGVDLKLQGVEISSLDAEGEGSDG